MRVSRVVAVLAGVTTLAAGAWAFAAPRSFFAAIASYPPYNEHFLRDIGAFNIGLGVGLLVSAAMTDGLLVALTAAGTGSAFHAASHWIDRGAGGLASDPWVFSAAAALLLATAVIRRKEVRDARAGRRRDG